MCIPFTGIRPAYDSCKTLQRGAAQFEMRENCIKRAPIAMMRERCCARIKRHCAKPLGDGFYFTWRNEKNPSARINKAPD